MRLKSLRKEIDKLERNQSHLEDRRAGLVAEIREHITAHNAKFRQAQIREARAELAMTEQGLKDDRERLDVLKEGLPSDAEVKAAITRQKVLEREDKARQKQFDTVWNNFTEAEKQARDAGEPLDALRHQGRQALSEAEKLQYITGVHVSVGVPSAPAGEGRWAALMASRLEATATGGDPERLFQIDNELGEPEAVSKAA